MMWTNEEEYWEDVARQYPPKVDRAAKWVRDTYFKEKYSPKPITLSQLYWRLVKGVSKKMHLDWREVHRRYHDMYDHIDRANRRREV